MEIKNISAEYLQGFNDGYLLSEHEPALAGQLNKIDVKNGERVKGLKAGIEQFQKEKNIERYPKWLNKSRLSKQHDDSTKKKEKVINPRKDKDK